MDENKAKYVMEVEATPSGEVAGRCYYIKSDGKEGFIHDVKSCMLLVASDSDVVFSIIGPDVSLIPALSCVLSGSKDFRDTLITAIRFGAAREEKINEIITRQ